jgi:hypothetical protein
MGAMVSLGYCEGKSFEEVEALQDKWSDKRAYYFDKAMVKLSGACIWRKREGLCERLARLELTLESCWGDLYFSGYFEMDDKPTYTLALRAEMYESYIQPPTPL